MICLVFRYFLPLRTTVFILIHDKKELTALKDKSAYEQTETIE